MVIDVVEGVAGLVRRWSPRRCVRRSQVCRSVYGGGKYRAVSRVLKEAVDEVEVIVDVEGVVGLIRW